MLRHLHIPHRKLAGLGLRLNELSAFADTVLPLQLAMITLGVTFAGGALAMRGDTKAKEQGPPINATSKEEENFIKYVQS